MENMGAAYVFVETQEDWVQQAKLTATDGAARRRIRGSSRNTR